MSRKIFKLDTNLNWTISAFFKFFLTLKLLAPTSTIKFSQKSTISSYSYRIEQQAGRIICLASLRSTGKSGKNYALLRNLYS